MYLNTSLGDSTRCLSVEHRTMNQVKRTSLEFDSWLPALYTEIGTGEFCDLLGIGSELYHRQLNHKSFDHDESGKLVDPALIGNPAVNTRKKITSVDEYMNKHEHTEIYFSVNEIQDWRQNNSTRAWKVMHTEVDVKYKKSPERASEVLEQVLQSIEDSPLPYPSVVVSSGSGGWHLYWLVAEDNRLYRHPSDNRLGGTALIDDMRDAQKMLYETLEHFRARWDNKQQKMSKRLSNWKIDEVPTKIISQPMRLPGSFRTINNEQVQCRAFALSEPKPFKSSVIAKKIKHDVFEWFDKKILTKPVVNDYWTIAPFSQWMKFNPRCSKPVDDIALDEIINKKRQGNKQNAKKKSVATVTKIKSNPNINVPGNRAGIVTPLRPSRVQAHIDAVKLIRQKLYSSPAAKGTRDLLCFHLFNSFHISYGCPKLALNAVLELRDNIGLTIDQIKSYTSTARVKRYYYAAFNLNAILNSIGIDTSNSEALSNARPPMHKEVASGEELSALRAAAANRSHKSRTDNTVKKVVDIVMYIHKKLNVALEDITGYQVSKCTDGLNNVSKTTAYKYIDKAISLIRNLGNRKVVNGLVSKSTIARPPSFNPLSNKISNLNGKFIDLLSNDESKQYEIPI
jgi:hypothetical protein